MSERDRCTSPTGHELNGDRYLSPPNAPLRQTTIARPLFQEDDIEFWARRALAVHPASQSCKAYHSMETETRKRRL